MAKLGTRLLVLTIGGDDYTAEISKAAIGSRKADSDFVTFEDAKNGGKREYYLTGVLAQDLAVGSLWDLIWSSPGDTVAYLIKPYGNASASAGQPHLSGNLTITEPEGEWIGGEADESTTAVMTAEIEWVLDAKPTKVTS